MRSIQLESPFVQVFVAVGIAAAAGIVNFVVLTSAASACNSAIFSTSRMVYSLAKDNNAPVPFTKLTSHKVPSNALFFSTIVILIAVVLNYIMPEGVFTLITSISTVCFIFIWGITVICHLKYRKTRPDLARRNKFKMPLYPISNYLILIFLSIRSCRTSTCRRYSCCIVCNSSLVYFIDCDLYDKDS